MSEPNIVWTRIDERLLHGQIRITWGKQSNANLILVANDAAAAENDQAEFQRSMMKAAAGGEYAVRFFTVAKTIDVIHKANPKQAIFILCNNPTDVADLVDGGVPIKAVNVGNMHYHEGKKQIDKTVSVDDKDIDAFRRLAAKGVVCTVQNTPDKAAVDIFELIDKNSGE